MIWLLIVLNTIADVVLNIFLLLTIMLTSPLFASVGCILVIPLSSLADYFISGKVLPSRALIGVALIVIGFFMIVYAEVQEEKKHKSAENSEAHKPINS